MLRLRNTGNNQLNQRLNFIMAEAASACASVAATAAVERIMDAPSAHQSSANGKRVVVVTSIDDPDDCGTSL